MINLNELRNRAFRCAKKYGFYNGNYSDEHYLMLVVTELTEIVEAERVKRRGDKESYLRLTKGKNEFKHGFFTYYIKNTVEDEMADVMIRLLSFAGYKDFDLSMIMARMTPEVYEEYMNKGDKTITEEMYQVTDIVASMRDPEVQRVFYAIAAMMMIAEKRGIDLFWHIEMKMAYNEQRPYMHGKQY